MSDLSEREIDALGRVHRAISSVAGTPFVIVGGWAARLLKRHRLARAGSHEPLHTEDLDLAAPDQIPGNPGHLATAITAEGFAPDYRSEDRPPVTRYLLQPSNDFELEFIAPLRGGETLRDGTPDITADLLGVSAQKLRHVELLLIEPCAISMPEIGSDASFQVVNPASFILQRMLVLSSRPSLNKKGKDALYIYDALLLFTHGGRIHAEVIEQAGRVLSQMTRKQRTRCRSAVELLGDGTHDTVKEAVRIMAAAGRPDPPSAQAFALACRLGLLELTASSDGEQ